MADIIDDEICVDAVPPVVADVVEMIPALPSLRFAISLNLDAPIVLLDWSFIVFWRFFATKSWYIRVRPAPGVDDPPMILSSEHAFVESFTRSFVKSIETIRKKYGAPKGNVVALMDAPRATLWRKAIFPTYKDNRDFKKSPIERDFFVIAERLQAQLGVQGVRMDTLEADDLAYLFKRSLVPLGAKNVVMVTDDNDWGQLACDEIRVRNVEDKDIGVRCGVLQQKILCGDPGDNIPPAFKRCGKVTGARYAADACALESFFVKNPEARCTFERNRKLIDLSCIPQVHVDAFESAVVIVPSV